MPIPILFLLSKTQNCNIPVVGLSAKDNQKLSKVLSKGFERSVYHNEYKTQSENKNATNDYRNLLESNLVGVDNVKRFKTRRYYPPKGIITSSSTEKTLMTNLLILR